MQIPAGQAWLCWRGCPQGVTRSGAGARGRTDSGGAPEGSSSAERRTMAGGGGTRAVAAGSVVARGPAQVLVAGVAIDLVPVWLRFGTIVPMALLQSSGRRGAAAGGGVHGQQRRRMSRLDSDRVLRDAPGDTGSLRGEWLGRGGGVRAGEAAPGRRGGAEPGVAAGGAAEANASAIDFGAVLTAEEALQRPRQMAVLLSASAGGGGTTGVIPYLACTLSSLRVAAASSW